MFQVVLGCEEPDQRRLGATVGGMLGSEAEVSGTGSLNCDPGQPMVPVTHTGQPIEEFRANHYTPIRKESFVEPQPVRYTLAMIEDLRKRNRLYFLDPVTKLMHRHGFPWKLSLQIVKIFIIVTQVILFGDEREEVVNFYESSTRAFEHILLKDWDLSYETMPYPPAGGPYALYEVEDFYDHINFALDQYQRIPQESLTFVALNTAPSGKARPVRLCYTMNDVQEFSNGTYLVHSEPIDACLSVSSEKGTEGNYTYDIEQFLEENGIGFDYKWMVQMYLQMYLTTYHLDLEDTHFETSCYNESIRITYDSNEGSGQVLIYFDTYQTEIDCIGQEIAPEQMAIENEEYRELIAVDIVVIVCCCLSAILCARSIILGNKLRKDTAAYFKHHRKQPLTLGDQTEYINMWYVVIICNDIFMVTGSAFKIQLESRMLSVVDSNYEICSVVLGCGVLLTFVGVLRYLSFFRSYNVLILTLKTSFPHVLRFLACAACLYCGFLLCGWVIFSPYNIKFRTLSSTSECIYSLLNGDDMYTTFTATITTSDAIWYTYRAYLYIFISLFIYMVNSVFIAVIVENYHNLKKYYKGETCILDTPVQMFIREGGNMSLKELFSHVRQGDSCLPWFFCMFPCLGIFKSISTSRVQ